MVGLVPNDNKAIGKVVSEGSVLMRFYLLFDPQHIRELNYLRFSVSKLTRSCVCYEACSPPYILPDKAPLKAASKALALYTAVLVGQSDSRPSPHRRLATLPKAECGVTLLARISEETIAGCKCRIFDLWLVVDFQELSSLYARTRKLASNLVTLRDFAVKGDLDSQSAN